MSFFRQVAAAVGRGVTLHGELTAEGPDGPVTLRGEDGRVVVDVPEGARVPPPPGLGRRELTALLDSFVKLSGQTVHVTVGGSPAISFGPGASMLGRVLGLRDARPKVHSFRLLRGLLKR